MYATLYYNKALVLSDLICDVMCKKLLESIVSKVTGSYSLLFHLQNSELPDLYLPVLGKSRSRVELIKSELKVLKNTYSKIVRDRIKKNNNPEKCISKKVINWFSF